MYNDFARLVVVLATISLISWAFVGVTALARFAARLRYRHARVKGSSISEGYQS